MPYLKQSTAYTFRLGPFVDSVDGNTEKNALTIAATSVLLSKAGGALAAKTEATALTGTGANAHYTCLLDATDTGTLGYLRVWCHVTGALAVYKDFIVLPANVYDSLVAGSDALQVDTIQVGGTAQTARDLGAALVGVIATGTHNPQTGDAFARLGVPAGASVSADVATRATPAQVNAEVLDVLNVDTFAEPGQEVPAATNTLAKKIGYLFKFLRNKATQNSTTLSVYADDGITVDQKATVSDSGTEYTRGEIGSGP